MQLFIKGESSFCNKTIQHKVLLKFYSLKLFSVKATRKHLECPLV